MNNKNKRVAVITGPTATGKSRVALDLAHELATRGMPAQIISMDSMQVYKYMDIGTDKVMPEQQEGVHHHLIDVAYPDETFSAARFQKEADRIIEELYQKGKTAVLAGGTGFYLHALLYGLFPGPCAVPDIRQALSEEADEHGLSTLHQRLMEIDRKAATRIHPNDRVRIIRALEVFEVTGEPISAHFEKHRQKGPRYDALVIGLDMDRETMYQRIDRRAGQMMEEGLVEEVQRLRDMGYGPWLASQQALGYKQVHAMLDGEVDRDRALYLIKRDTRRFARRQLTWLRNQEELAWMPVAEKHAIIQRAARFLEGEDDKKERQDRENTG